MVEEIRYNDLLLAIIVRAGFNEEGIKFFTPDDFSQQIAFMRHKEGKLIPPHVHNPVPREVTYTKEVLIIRKGKLRVDFYDDCKRYIESRVLFAGDLILLSVGGHGFTVLEDLEMFEIKQGPYAGDLDKTRFTGVSEDEIYLR